MIYNLPKIVKKAVEENSWSVADISGVYYKFALNSSGYYESNNKGVASSAAMCRVNLKITKTCNVVFSCINYAEANYDYGLLGTLDTAMATGYSNVSTGVAKSFKGSSKSSVQTYTYSNVSAGDHFIDVKYRKDGSADSNNDSLQFTVELEAIEKEKGSFTIDNVAYQFEIGMTWQEWVSSSYNTGGYIIGSVDTYGDNILCASDEIYAVVTVSGHTVQEATDSPKSGEAYYED